MILPRWRWLWLALTATVLAACSPEPEQRVAKPNPLLFEIAGPSGEVEGWMLGTIHALPKGTRWRNEQIDDAIDRADYLIVEIADLSDRTGIGNTFAELATSPGQPALASRVAPGLEPALGKLIARGNYDPSDFDNTETWAAALILARTGDRGDAASGVDRAVISDFAGREIREFEGAAQQLAIFDTLPETDQRDLLEAVVVEMTDAKRSPRELSDAWLAGAEERLEEATSTGSMADKGLRYALLVRRNAAWAIKLARDLEAAPRPLVAVGAGHLVGPDSLVEKLRERGYTVTRLRR